MAIYSCGGVSGASLNPAVNFAFAIVGKLSWIHAVFYSFAQYAGAFVASAVVYTVQYGKIIYFITLTIVIINLIKFDSEVYRCHDLSA